MAGTISKPPTIQALLELWDDERLFAFLGDFGAATRDFFRGGFKFCAASVGKIALRGRIVQELRHNHEFFVRWLDSPRAPWQKWRAPLALLDEGWLRGNWRHLLRTPNGLPLVAALATDSRPPLARRALRTIVALRHPWRLRALPADWQPEGLAELAAALASDSAAVPAGAGAAPAGALRAARFEAEQARASRDKHRAKIVELESKLANAELAWQTERKALRAELAERNSEIEALRQAQRREFGQRLDAYRAEIFGQDGTLDALRAKLAENAGADLLAKGREMLAAQARLDLKFGTISGLRREQQQLEELCGQLDECTAESLNLIPEIHSLRRQLAARLAEIAALLPAAPATAEAPAPESLDGRLRNLIDSAGPDEEGNKRLMGIATFLAGPLAAEMLGETEAQRLRQRLDARHSKLAVRRRERSLAQLAPPRAGPAAASGDKAQEIWEVDLELRRISQPPVLIVDAYNLIKKDPELSRKESSEGLPAARAELLRRCLARGRHFAAINLVYDGQGALATRETQGPVTVVFAPARDDSQNADNWIVDWLGKPTDSTAPADPSVPVWLATDDFILRQRAARACQGFIDTADLAKFLA